MIQFDDSGAASKTPAQRLAEMLEWAAAQVATDCYHDGKPDPAGLEVVQDLLTALKQE